MADYKITLYESDSCPFVQRVRILLKELNLKYDSVPIDLSVPRPDWYLKEINHRGLIPAIKISGTKFNYDNVILTESSVIVQFLSDLFTEEVKPSIQPISSEGPLARAKIAYFADTTNSKLFNLLQQVSREKDNSVRKTKISEAIDHIVNEVDPLLESTKGGKFFGGSDQITLAEVLTAPGLQRAFHAAEKGKVLPTGYKAEIASRTKYFIPWVEKVLARPSVHSTYPADQILPLFLAKFDAQHSSQQKDAKV